MRENSATLRRQVYARDKGICRWCGFDADQFDRIIDHADLAFTMDWMGRFGLPRGEAWVACSEAWRTHVLPRIKLPLGLPDHRDDQFWDAHHHKQVVDGGGGIGLDNVVTTCIWCHKDVTRENAAKNGRTKRRAKARQKRKDLQEWIRNRTSSK